MSTQVYSPSTPKILVLLVASILATHFSCTMGKTDNAARDILDYADLYKDNPDLFRADSLWLAKEDSLALREYKKFVAQPTKNEIARQHAFGKMLVLSRDSSLVHQAVSYLKSCNKLTPTALLEWSQFQLKQKDSDFPVAEIKAFITSELRPFNKGRAGLILAGYYETKHYDFDSIWHYLQLAHQYFSLTGHVTFPQVNCLESLCAHATYRRKNLLAIRYANHLCEFDRYWPGAERVDSASAYANRAFMLFREDDMTGSLEDIQQGLDRLQPLDQPSVFQSLLKSYLAIYMIQGQDSLWWESYQKLEENIRITGQDFIESGRWLGQYLYYAGKYQDCIPILQKVWEKEVASQNTFSARYSTLCYLLSDAHLQIGHADQALQFMYANQRRFGAYQIDSMLSCLASESVYPFSPATECANIYFTTYQKTGQVNHLYDAEKFIQTIDRTLYSHMKVAEENALLQFYFETGRQYFDLGLHVNYALFQQTGDTMYVNRFLEYSEKRKSSLLHKDLLLGNIQGGHDGHYAREERKLRAAIKEEKRNGMRDNPRFNELVDVYEILENKYRHTKATQTSNLLLENLDQTPRVLSDMVKNKAAVLIVDETDEVWYFTRVDDTGKKIVTKKYEQRLIDSVSALTEFLSRHQDVSIHTYSRAKMEMFFPADILHRLPKQVTVIPDGVYHRMPLSAMFDPVTYQVDIVPSIRVWQVLQKKHTGKQVRKAAAFAFTDPETVRGKTRTYLAELPGTFKEVQKLRDQYPGITLYTGKEATLDHFWKVYEDPDMDYIHLALHGRANSMEKDEVKLYFRTKAGGLDSLYGYELLAHRSNCQKVVLSACQSGLGKYIKGEGNYSLPRYFMLNGAYDIQSNLWDVLD